ncbi:unnamed protein product, partial [Laminaria digitata]
EEQGRYHELCKKPEVDPLEEPRLGLRYWSDAVPLEILAGWKASQQRTEDDAAQQQQQLPTNGNGKGSGGGREKEGLEGREKQDE